jgi:cytochrome c-type biogenesis protein CcmF
MLPEIAHFCMILALCFALLLSTVPLLGVYLHDNAMMRTARPLAVVMFGFVAIAFAVLMILFIQSDFSVKVVAQTSNLSLPLFYKVTALWGGHEGSMLLWIFTLACWTAAVALFSKQIPDDMIARVLAVMAMISVGFLLFSIITSNPFERVLPNIPADGRDLNPLLQDVGMAIHPPMLYIGYVGFSVAFAFAIAALMSGEFDAAWVRWTRPWTTAAWVFLTLGISLGSWWAYYELGWGGWWFWDPVENASFMPWLVGTALIHSLAVTEQRSLFKSWTILLAIFTFSLILLGAFLVRSGVLTSVHSFAADPGRGLFILAFLCVVIGGSLTLFAFRAPTVRSSGSFSFFSREMFLLFNNVLLVVAAITVLLGTLFPLLADYLELGKYSVGPPYFNAVFVPIMLVLIVLMGIGSLLRWKQTRRDYLLSIVKIIIPLGLVLTVFFTAIYGAGFHVATVTSFSLAAWLLAGIIFDFWHKTRYAKSLAEGLRRLTLSFYGMQLAHIGLIVSAVGIGIVSNYNYERDIRMGVGESAELHEYQVVFHGHKNIAGPNYRGQAGHFTVFEDNKIIAELYPEKRQYLSQMGNVMTEAAIDDNLARDVFIALGEPLENDAWAVRLQYKPFIRLIWLGTILMALGGVLTIFDKRYR